MCSIGSEPPSYASSVGRRNCALKKLVESEESVLRSGRLRTDGLGMDVGRLTTSPEMARLNFDGGQGRSSASCVVEG
ncbi:hypothetical protein BHM03_00046912 [Ensete ventricosum]|nr:hypothetical protein BHM03_00046912 [Ensete ventricosum]